MQFKAVAPRNEISFSKLAQHFSVAKKLKWEEPFALQGELLANVIKEPGNKVVYIFQFGSLVFIDFKREEMSTAIRYLKGIEPGIGAGNPWEYSDDYELKTGEVEKPEITNDYIIVARAGEYHREIIATILAKSVALERIEVGIDGLLDKIENVIEYLRRGKFGISDKKLAQLSADILGYKLNLISYIMLLDKPSITWFREEASLLFDELSKLFELTERYEKIRHKSEILMDITEVFSSLVHATKGNRLEWIIIILFAIELLFSIILTVLK